MDFNREWTAFALEAEYDAHGMATIASAHNALQSELDAAKAERDELQRDFAHHEAQIGYITAQLASANEKLATLAVIVKALFNSKDPASIPDAEWIKAFEIIAATTKKEGNDEV